MGKIYYCQMFLEECMYIVKEKEVTWHISEELEISSDDSDESGEEQLSFIKRSKKISREWKVRSVKHCPSLHIFTMLCTIFRTYKSQPFF